MARERAWKTPLYWVLANWIYATKHKLWVTWYMFKACIALMHRAVLHDLSRYAPREVESFEDWTRSMRGVVYGSQEYLAISKRFARDNELHYSINRHHPEYWPGGAASMPLLDQIEMLVDWQAAGRRAGGRDIRQSIKINQGRFGYDDALKARLLETVKEWDDSGLL